MPAESTDHLTAPDRSFLQMVFDELWESGSWPNYRALEMALRKETPLQSRIRSLPTGLVVSEPGRDDGVVRLTIKGIALCENSEPCLQLLLAAARHIAKHQIAKASGELTDRQLQDAMDLADRERLILGKLLFDLGGCLTAGGGRQRDWSSYSVRPGAKAYLFENVATLEDFQRQADREDELRRMESSREDTPWLRTRPLSRLSFPAPGPGAAALGELDLHAAVLRASRDLFNNQATAEAVRAAFQAFEAYIQQVTGDQRSHGAELMSRAFGGRSPSISLNAALSKTDTSEQDGFKFLTMGAMQAIRNVLSHGPLRQVSAEEALECLAFASFLFRRVERATGIEAIVVE